MSIKTKATEINSGKTVITTYLTEELQNKMNGMSLHQVQEEELIVAENFEFVTKKYPDGQEHSRWEMVTDKGNILLSGTLSEAFTDYEEANTQYQADLKAKKKGITQPELGYELSDLVLKVGHTDGTEERPSVRFFRLQRPGGGIVEERHASNIGQ